MNVELKISIVAQLINVEVFVKMTGVVIIVDSTDKTQEDLEEYKDTIVKKEIESDLKDKKTVKDQESHETIKVEAVFLELHARHPLKLLLKLLRKKVVLLKLWVFIQTSQTRIFINCFLLKELYKNALSNKTTLVDH